MHACTHVHRVVRASVACVRAWPKVDFWEISEIYHFGGDFSKILEKQAFLFFEQAEGQARRVK